MMRGNNSYVLKKMPTLPTTSLTSGMHVHGFAVRAVTPIEELNLVAIELEHEKSGARMLHLLSQDDENLFSINFPTPNRDDRGIPHILEHTVLCGSRQYPVRDPFFELVKMSMATFLNAMTGRDCTYYPVSSNVEKDLFNLADVYFDAVFHPLLTENSFKREGHHLCPADAADPVGKITVNGIVYNEMKSVFSKPEGRIERDIYKGILPETVFGCESGGDPEVIPTLTYADFKDFYRTWYHPSNARIVTYGNVATEKFLAFLDPRLSEFDRTEPKPEFPRQTKWESPQRLEASYAAEENEDLAHQTFHVLTWLIPQGLDRNAGTLWSVLTSLMAGDDAAPLKRALVDSGLGEDVLVFDPIQADHDGLFGIGIRGSDPDKFAAFRDLVRKTLEGIVRKGFDSDVVESAFRREIFSAREIAPRRGLMLADEVLSSWILDGDPLQFLREGADAEACRALWRQHRSLFQDMIREHLLENPHRLDYTLAPSAAYQAAIDERFQQEMSDKRATLTDEDMRALADEDARLQEEAGRPNSPEALATLPQLGRDDLPEAPAFLPTTESKLPCGVPFLRTDLFSNGVNYVNVAVDLTGLPAELWPILPYYCMAFNSMGAAGQDFAETERRATASTGSILCQTKFLRSFSPDVPPFRGLIFSVKALDETLGAALDLLGDKLVAADPRDRRRLRDLVTQSVTRGRSALANAGVSPALLRISATFDEECWLTEQLSGTTGYRFAHALQKNFDKRVQKLTDMVLRIQKFLRSRARYTISFVGSDAAAAQVHHSLDTLLSLFPADPLQKAGTGFRPVEGTLRLGLADPMQVAHCSQILPAIPKTHPDAPIFALGCTMLAVDYAIAELRFKGNAYGASCSYQNNCLQLTTYADPHIKRTLDVFRTLPDFIRSAPWTDVEVTRGILNRAKHFIRPTSPEGASFTALDTYLAACTPEDTIARYNRLRSATPEEIKAVLLATVGREGAFDQAPIGIVSSREKLEKANAELGPDAALTLEPLFE